MLRDSHENGKMLDAWITKYTNTPEDEYNVSHVDAVIFWRYNQIPKFSGLFSCTSELCQSCVTLYLHM